MKVPHRRIMTKTPKEKGFEARLWRDILCSRGGVPKLSHVKQRTPKEKGVESQLRGDVVCSRGGIG